MDRYIPAEYHFPMNVIWGGDDPYLEAQDPYADWRAVASQVNYVTVPGDHHFIDSDTERLFPYL